MEKTFKTTTEQIKLLKCKQLKIKDINLALNILENNNYYYLINGYKNLFIDFSNNTEKYIQGTTIEEIYSLYEFDRKIRIIFLEYILLIERKIDTYIAYEFSKEHGYKDYLIPDNFDYNKKNKKIVDKLLKDINLEISHQYKNSNKMIKHYIDTYNYIPLWVLIRILSFGKNSYHSILKIEKLRGNYKSAVQDLFSVVLILKIMLEKEQFNQFYKSLIKNIQELKKKINNIEFIKVLDKMGFPKNYKKLLNL